jgi:hypothetical protein
LHLAEPKAAQEAQNRSENGEAEEGKEREEERDIV